MGQSWKNFFILYSIQFLQLLDFMSITPLGAYLVKQGVIESHAISYALAAYSVAAIISSFLVGNLGRTNPKKTLGTLIVAFSLSQFALLLPISSNLFILAKIIGGFTGGLMGAIAYSQLSNIEAGQRTGIWNGRIQTAQSIATIAGIPICLFITSRFGTQTYFLAMVVSSILVFFSFAQSNFLKKNPPSVQKLTLGFALNHLDVVASGFLCYLSAFLFISHMPNFLLNSRGVSADQLSFSYMISGTITLLLAGTIGHIGEKKSARTLLISVIILITAIQFIFVSNASNAILLFAGIPAYLLVSNARAIYQRALILQKNADDSFILHLLNNVVVRVGILSSGLVLGVLSRTETDIHRLFSSANYSSIVISFFSIFAIFITAKISKASP